MTTLSTKKRFINAYFPRITEPDKTLERAAEKVNDPVEEKQYEYAFEFHGSKPHYNLFDFFLSKTSAEDKVSQWTSTETETGFKLVASCESNEPKTLRIGTISAVGVKGTSMSFSLEQVSVSPVDTAKVKESFVPAQLAVEIEGKLGLPTQGYVYHFIDGKCYAEYHFCHPYRCELMESYQYNDKFTLQKEPYQPHYPVVILPYLRNGSPITDQQLYYRANRLTQQELDAMTPQWLTDNHALSVDVKAIVDKVTENDKGFTSIAEINLSCAMSYEYDGMNLGGGVLPFNKSMAIPRTATLRLTEVKKRTLHIGVFFDGTGQNKDNDLYKEQRGNKSRSNVGRMFEGYPMESGVSEKIYVSGVGTVDFATDAQVEVGEDEEDLIQAGGVDATETGAVGTTGAFYKWQSLLRQLSDIIIQIPDYNQVTDLCFDVFGFSRGSALARHFVNAVNQGIPDYSQNNVIANPVTEITPNLLGNPDHEKFLHIIQDFFPRDTQRAVKVRFLGLFDTVGSFYLAGNNDEGEFTLGLQPNSAECVYQLTAEHEYRNNFPLTTIINPDNPVGHFYEEAFPGCHTDVGGGYPSMMQYGREDLNERFDTPIEPAYRRELKTSLSFSDKRSHFAYPGGSVDFEEYIERQFLKEEQNWQQQCLGSTGHHGQVKRDGTTLYFYELIPLSNALSGLTLSRMLQQSEKVGINWKRPDIPEPADKKNDALMALMWAELEGIETGKIGVDSWSHHLTGLQNYIHLPHEKTLMPGYGSIRETLINRATMEGNKLKRVVFDNE